MTYKTHGTCATAINLELDGSIVKSVSFVNGCSGNTQGVARLVEGMDAHDAIAKLLGIKCGFKSTSCPDQLSYALEEALATIGG